MQRFNRYMTLLRLLLDAAPDLSRWCPIVDAVHFRLVGAVDILSRHMSDAELTQCLQERDAFGQTVLHAAAGQAASGLARRAATGASSDAVLRYVGSQIDATIPRHVETGGGSTLSLVALTAGIGGRLLLSLLEASQRVQVC